MPDLPASDRIIQDGGNSWFYKIKGDLEEDIGQLFSPVISNLNKFKHSIKEGKILSIDELDVCNFLAQNIIKTSYPFFAYYAHEIIKKFLPDAKKSKFSIIPTYESEFSGRLL